MLTVTLSSLSRAFISGPAAHRSFVRTLSATTIEEASEAKLLPDKPKTRTSRVLSGVQPTGSLHLGNYLGAIRQWVDFQNAEPISDENGTITITENFFCVVDLHAITMPHDPKDLDESTKASAALYLAAGKASYLSHVQPLGGFARTSHDTCYHETFTHTVFIPGIDPAKSKVFVQSHVPAHSELAWLLNCITPMNWLERMIQFKDKAKKQGEAVGVGLFTYPVLMAADILLYQADQVPVGEDQRQHLELARDITRRFNDQFCKGGAYKKRCKEAGIPSRPVFLEPNPMIVKTGARVMSLVDGTSKMSKSDANDGSRINVLDPPNVIREKIKRCKTDSIVGLEWDNPDRPEASNLLNIYLAVQPGRTKQDILEEVRDLSWGDFKPLLADAVVAHLEPIQKRYELVRKDDAYLNQVLREGADAANEIASKTLHATRVAMGFTPLPPRKSE